MATRLTVKQVRSVVSGTAKQQGTIRALGLRRVGHTVTHEDKPEIRGMLRVVEHLIEVEEN